LSPAIANGLDLETLEGEMRKIALRTAARFLEETLNADKSDYAGPEVPCIFCGAQARYVDRRNKTFTTVLGDITAEDRAYYYCHSCGHGWCPKDYAFGFGESSLSPGVTRMIGMVAAEDPFMKGSKIFSALTGLPLSAKSMERAAKTLGAAMAADELAYAKEQPNSSDTMYAGVDGTGIPMRPTEVAGRPGKQADGTAKTREVKECVVWTADSRDRQGHPIKDKGSATYSAAIESCAWNDTSDEIPPFAQRVVRELTRRGFFLAKRQVFMGDGAPWIWNLAAMIAPEAIQIIDLCHAKEHLSHLADVIYRPGTDLAKKWAADRHEDLEAGLLDTVLDSIRPHISIPGEVGTRATNEFNYFNSNRARMAYADFRSKGLCVGSGVVEAGCKSVIGQRLKLSGMFWSKIGADAIIALRCYVRSDRYDEFWRRYRANNYRIPEKVL